MMMMMIDAVAGEDAEFLVLFEEDHNNRLVESVFWALMFLVMIFEVFFREDWLDFEGTCLILCCFFLFF